MVKYHSNSERGNPLLPLHGIYFLNGKQNIFYMHNPLGLDKHSFFFFFFTRGLPEFGAQLHSISADPHKVCSLITDCLLNIHSLALFEKFLHFYLHIIYINTIVQISLKNKSSFLFAYKYHGLALFEKYLDFIYILCTQIP